MMGLIICSNFYSGNKILPFISCCVDWSWVIDHLLDKIKVLVQERCSRQLCLIQVPRYPENTL